MGAGLKRLLKWGVGLIFTAILVFLGLRVYISQQGAPLEVWHTFVPTELTAEEMDAADWDDYLKVESAVFEQVGSEVTQRLDEHEKRLANRYFEGSPVFPGRFAHDWNRSVIMEPEGTAIGAVVLLHGLTDSPYSVRHVAQRYRELGFVAIAPRLPGHGTVPAGLTKATWEDWMAATRLAVREARRRVGATAPLHLVGYSNGGALAVKFVLDAIENPGLSRVHRVVLLSPMIGLTEWARFAGLAGLPSVFPAFAKTAWLSIVPEFNPFKYNSFPVNAARQSSLLTGALQPRIARLAREGRLADLPPILTFQSVTDFTVSTGAVVDALYAQLPANGSELVLVDLNRSAKFGFLLRPSLEAGLATLLPDAPRRFRTAVIANASPDSTEMVERTVDVGALTEQVRSLSLAYPSEVFSLSHIALPFPIDDGLYGMTPDPSEDFGVQLGAIAARGERGTLIISVDALTRMSSNPFFPYVLARIDEGIATGR
jgi:alpha-beta hydrolase superfamily lysophospholipase